APSPFQGLFSIPHPLFYTTNYFLFRLTHQSSSLSSYHQLSESVLIITSANSIASFVNNLPIKGLIQVLALSLPTSICSLSDKRNSRLSASLANCASIVSLS